MKRQILIILAILVMAVQVMAADSKVSALTELATTPDDTDTLYIIDGTTSKKIQVSNLLGGVQGTLTNEAGLYAALADVSNFTQPNVIETITENWVNTANPWADNEVADDITINSADKVTALSVYTGTTSLEEATAADDSGAYIVGCFDEFANSTGANIQAVLNDLDSAIDGKEGTLTNEAGLYSALSDVSNFTQPNVIETITENWVNTANPWADNEVANDITASNYMPLAGGVFSAFPTTPEEAPDADYEIANKKYVDDNSGGSGDLLADGTVPLTANWDVGAFTLRGTQFISDIAIGTAPFVVTSTDVVTNLNADLLDGESASAFQDADAFLDDIAALTDPGADRIAFWDDTAGDIVWLSVGAGLTITGTEMTASASATALDDVGDPDAASDINFGTYITKFFVDDFQIGGDATDYIRFTDTGITLHGAYTITTGPQTIADEAIAIQTGTSDADFFEFGAYDLDTGPAYNGLFRLVAGNTIYGYLGDNQTNAWRWDETGGLAGLGTASIALPNGAAPTTDATGEIALDTTIIDHQPLLQYYDGGENMTVIAIDTAELPALDKEIIKYDAATDKFVLEADDSAGTVCSSAEINTGTDNAKFVSPDALAGSNAFTKEAAWTIVDSDTVTAVADGKQAFVVPASMVGMNLIDVTASVHDLNSASGGTTTVVIRRVRGATPADMTSTGVTISHDAYTASDETVDAANDDLALGDKIYVDVNAVTTGAVQKGLSVTALFRLP